MFILLQIQKRKAAAKVQGTGRGIFFGTALGG